MSKIINKSIVLSTFVQVKEICNTVRLNHWDRVMSDITINNVLSTFHVFICDLVGNELFREYEYNVSNIPTEMGKTAISMRYESGECGGWWLCVENFNQILIYMDYIKLKLRLYTKHSNLINKAESTISNIVNQQCTQVSCSWSGIGSNYTTDMVFSSVALTEATGFIRQLQTGLQLLLNKDSRQVMGISDDTLIQLAVKAVEYNNMIIEYNRYNKLSVDPGKDFEGDVLSSFIISEQGKPTPPLQEISKYDK